MTFGDASATELPPTASTPLKALRAEARGNWDDAHALVQDYTSGDGAWVHAYLHRKEGDLSNAQYWYRRAGKSMPAVALQKEWEQIVHALMQKGI